jgi:hypothetical protein
MKKLLFLLVVVLFSCEKDSTCWYCRRDVFAPQGNYSVVIEVCDQSESDIKTFEKENTYMAGTSTLVMTCWEKDEPPQ